MRAMILTATFVVPLMALAEETTEELCGPYAEMARGIMTARQNGVPMDQLFSLFADAVKAHPETGDLVRTSIMAAYEVPRWNTQENQQAAVIDYGNEVMMMCMKAQSAD